MDHLILEVAREHGIDIPTLCHHGAPCSPLEPAGSAGWKSTTGAKVGW
ncbi:MAG: 2Fe-2S iron-sulfur cluster-binding protein [Desulfobaccales bacterium]